MSRPRLDRTNSSLTAREVLKQDYAVVPEVSSTVDLEKYISYARSAFYNAAKLYQKGDLKRAFVDFEKFQKFANEQLPNHAGVYALHPCTMHLCTVTYAPTHLCITL
jgi:hypothetical protein